MAVAPFRERWKGLLFIFEWKTWAVFGLVWIVSALAWILFSNVVAEPNPAIRSVTIGFLTVWEISLGKFTFSFDVNFCSKPNF